MFEHAVQSEHRHIRRPEEPGNALRLRPPGADAAGAKHLETRGSDNPAAQAVKCLRFGCLRSGKGKGRRGKGLTGHELSAKNRRRGPPPAGVTG